MKEVRVRFAPSPTGFLHVGGARTAIFNWLFAKRQKGKFLLRIEDTDPERSKSELSTQIIRSMKWLRMEEDEPVVYQSDNINRHKEVVKMLLDSGKAYYAFETSAELEAKRKEAQVLKTSYKYDRSSLKLNKDEIKKYLDEGKEYAVRFLVPEGTTEFEDIVHGVTTFQNSELEDFVILRSDGSPVYQMAVVVDDHDMNITHVIRGDDHLSNTPKQILLFKALGWEVPLFAHLPMILDEQKKKLSKRRNTVSVEEYKSLGYLPEALFNFLTLLGFAPQNNREVISIEELVNEFTFERVNKKSAVFDMKKLAWINSEYIKSYDENSLAKLIKEKLNEKNIIAPGKKSEVSIEYIVSVIRLMKERISTINDLVEFGKYFFSDPETYDEKGLAKYWNGVIKIYFKEYIELLSNYKEFPAPDIMEADMRKFAELKGIKTGQLIHPIRLALTGISISPGIFELVNVLGKEIVLKRVSEFIKIM